MTQQAPPTPCTCREKFPDFNLDDYAPYDDCAKTCALWTAGSSAPPPPPPPPPAAPPQAGGRQPRDYTNNELGGGDFVLKAELDVTPPDMAQNALLAGSNLAIQQPIRESRWHKETGALQAISSAALRLRKDSNRAWTDKDGKPVLDRKGEQLYSTMCTIIHTDPTYNGMEVEVSTGGNAIVKAMLAVPDGMTVNVVRLPNVGNMLQYRIMEAIP